MSSDTACRDPDPALRQRLRRGMLELDLMLARFHREAYPGLTDTQRRAFARLLAAEDDELWSWLTARGDPEDPELSDAARRIRRHAGL